MKRTILAALVGILVGGAVAVAKDDILEDGFLYPLSGTAEWEAVLRCEKLSGVAERTEAALRGINVLRVCTERIRSQKLGKKELAPDSFEEFIAKGNKTPEPIKPSALLEFLCSDSPNFQQCVGEVTSHGEELKKASEIIKAEKKKRQERDNLIQGALLVVIIAVIASVFLTRRKIAAAFSSQWRRQSKVGRAWAFSSFAWAIGTLLFVLLVDPYGSRMNEEEILHMLGVMFIPPLFLGAVWFGYKRFVDIEATEVQLAENIAEPENKTEEDHDQKELRTDTIAAEVQRPVSTSTEAPLPVERGKVVTVLMKVVGSVIALTVLFIVSAAISELTAEKKFISQLSLALSIPFLIAIWHRAATSMRITAALVGSGAGLAVWGLGIAMLDSGMSSNPVIISSVVSGSMLVSGALAFFVCRRQKASPPVRRVAKYDWGKRGGE